MHLLLAGLQMKKGARIINVARGGVIDDHALARALDAKIVAAAGGPPRTAALPWLVFKSRWLI